LCFGSQLIFDEIAWVKLHISAVCFAEPHFFLSSLVTVTQLLQMLQGSNISNQKTLYEALSVSEDATYDEIRAAYKSAALNTHPDKSQTTLESFVSSSEEHDFLGVQEAWEILRYPNHEQSMIYSCDHPDRVLKLLHLISRLMI
jgi:preprotein translocase subunit Sec63